MKAFFKFAVRRTRFEMFYLVSGLIACISFVNAQHVLLNTSQGAVKGTIEKSRAGRPFFAFYRIPYAEPPVGELRFENPVPPKPWDEERDCTILPPACLSDDPFTGKVCGQEDCLYLNVYTPKLMSDTPLPVMVFVYGGMFMYLNALPGKYGAHYFMDKDVIIITFHYRLGVLGFLSTEDEYLPGNYALKDFAAVLRWVQEHIHTFNGDKNRVTVFGGSSGACTSSFALISPLTQGLFHRSISQSGFPTYSVLPRGVARKRARTIAKTVGCAHGDSEHLRSCLKRVPAVDLIKSVPTMALGVTENSSITIQNNETMGVTFPFAAVIENEKSPGAFLVDSPELLLPRRSEVPWMVGITSDEGSTAAMFTYFGYPIRAQVIAKNYRIYFPLLMGWADSFEEAAKLAKAADRLKEVFFGDTDIEKNPIAFAKMINLVYLPVLKKSLDLYRGPKYVFIYGHKNTHSYSRFYVSYPPELDFGVFHGDEIASLFNATDNLPPVTEGLDYIVSEQMIELWTNFATFGDPNGMGEKIWTTWNSSRIEHLHISSGKLQMRDELLKEEFELLDELNSMVKAIKKN